MPGKICSPFSVLALFACAQGTPNGRAQAADFSKVQELVHERVDSGAAMSIAIAVTQHGRIVWEHAYGLSDREKRIAASVDTPYYLASLSKAITATALMKLAVRKELDLDRPANDYLGMAKLSSPWWDASTATVRRVANHTAGLATYDRACYSREPNCRVSGQELVRRYGLLVWPPGARFDYSNAGYGILGEIIAQRSHRSLGEVLRREVFEPLGMTSCLLDTELKGMKKAAVRYTSLPPHEPTPRSISTTPGGSAIYCSAHDIALFGMFHLKDHLSTQRAILSDNSIDDMQHLTVPVDARSRYGLSWWVQDLHGFSSVLAQGGTLDATAYLQLLPSEDVAVAMLWNMGTPSGQPLVDEALATLLPRYRQALERDLAVKPNPRKPSLAEMPPPDLVGQWAGSVRTYRGEVALAVSIDTGGGIKAKLGSTPELKVDRSHFGKTVVSWRMPGTLNLDDPWLVPYSINFELYTHENLLAGAATTRPEPQAKHGAQLSFQVELKKTRGSAQ